MGKLFHLHRVVPPERANSFSGYCISIIGNISFSHDSTRLAFNTSPLGSWVTFVVVDGVEGQQYNLVRTTTGSTLTYSAPMFGPDSMHLVYMVNGVIVIDGIETQEYGTRVSTIVFDSANGYHYLADKDGDIYLVERNAPWSHPSLLFNILKRHFGKGQALGELSS